VDNVWHPVRKALAAVRAELGDMHIHDLRHVYATALLVSGASEASIAPLLGHKSTAMTKRYAHTSPDYLAAERAKLTRALAPPAPKRIAPPTSKRGRKVVAR
jgi:site-specific recombinase XerD